jgi:hypothetical protein
MKVVGGVLHLEKVNAMFKRDLDSLNGLQSIGKECKVQ